MADRRSVTSFAAAGPDNEVTLVDRLSQEGGVVFKILVRQRVIFFKQPTDMLIAGLSTSERNVQINSASREASQNIC